MEIFKKTTSIDFMRIRSVYLTASLILTAVSLYVWFSSGEEKYGVDFRGGTDIVVKFEKDLQVSKVRQAVEAGGFRSAVVQGFENGKNEFSIRVSGVGQAGQEEGKAVREALAKLPDSKFEVLKEDYVGPIIGDNIRKEALIAIGLSLICILVYVSVRFEFAFALGGVASLLHDAIVISGIVVMSGREFNSAVLAAVLTIIGYSINDSIVVFDRVRENLGKRVSRERKKVSKQQGKDELLELINVSINQTLSRTMLTSVTTLIVSMALWSFGGGALRDLGFTLTIGILFGTYSSIFVACPIVYAYARGK